MKPKLNILAVNTGSSSIKFALYESGPEEVPILTGSLTRIGYKGGRFSVMDGEGRFVVCESVVMTDHAAACAYLFSWLLSQPAGTPDAVGHRIVHGGPLFSSPQTISPELIASIETIKPFASEHLPQAILAMRESARIFPGMVQVACFDTAFHRTMPPVAQCYPLPAFVREQGVQRYGFHGLSYEYLLGELQRTGGKGAIRGRFILAHLGHGASMAAVRDGKSIDTTMGFSPAGGLVMSTRSGDLDPGVILFLLQQDGMSPARIKEMVNCNSGLLGLSGRSDDMRDLLDREPFDARCHEAVELFCYQARKYIGALSTVLGGLDTLVFTGGIGEHSAVVRSRICEGLEFLGIVVDEKKNSADLPVISQQSGEVTVRVMKTNEELMIVRQTRMVIDVAEGNRQ